MNKVINKRKLRLMCEACFNLIDAGELQLTVSNHSTRISPDNYINFSEYYYCEKCGGYTFHNDIDDGIADIIQYLNKHGIATIYCCQGHSRVANQTTTVLDTNTNAEIEKPIEGIYTIVHSLPYIAIIEDESTNKELLDRIKSYDSEYWHGKNYDVLNDYHTILSVRFKDSYMEKFMEENEFIIPDTDFNALEKLTHIEEDIYKYAISELYNYIKEEN